MKNWPVFDEKKSGASPADETVGQFIARQTYNEWSKRSPTEETPLSNDPLINRSQFMKFEQVVLPHLDSAYNLARWLTGNEHDAEDVVQDAFLRAVRFFVNFRGGDARPWLLTIVRRACYDWLERNRPHQTLTVFDDEIHSESGADLDPAQLVLRQEDREMLRQMLSELPVEFREVLVLRELEGMSYKEIAVITDLRPGTIMSRLARGRERLRNCWVNNLREGA